MPAWAFVSSLVAISESQPARRIVRAALLSAPAVLLAGAMSAQADWVPARVLLKRQDSAAVMDEGRQRIVLFGGRDASGNWLADTWEWDGNSWTQRMASGPPARWYHALAYDTSRRRVVLFGGSFSNNGTVVGDTWEWNGHSWTQRTPATSPSPRSGHAMTYDGVRQRVVLVGRNSNGLSDTWEWDGTNWVMRVQGSGPPPFYWGPALAYDALRQRVVLFGGHSVLTPTSNETFEWDGTTWLHPTPTSRPPGRAGAAMTYDPGRQRIVMFGGRESGTYRGDTWEWNGTTWSLRALTITPGAIPVTMAFDASRQRPVLVGSDSEQAVGTWDWDGTNWSFLAFSTVIVRLGQSAMAYDPARQNLVVFGGSVVGGTLRSDDTYLYGATGWTRASPATRPPRRYATAMAYDAVRQRVVMYGGFATSGYSDTWEWDGSNWLQRSPATNPPAYYDHGMAWDPVRQRVLMVGSPSAPVLTADTWEWDGVDWTQRNPANRPSALSKYCVSYDAARSRAVLVGDNRNVFAQDGETWEWDGVDWSQRFSVVPTPRGVRSLTYHAARQRIVLEPQGAQTFEWDGTNWALTNPATAPPARYYSAMAYDEVRQRAVLFGGMGSGSLLGDTWFYGDIVPAAAQSIGTACPGSNGTPQITATMPFLGNPALHTDLLDARPSSPCIFGWALATQALPLGGGCTLYLANPIVTVFTVTNSVGFGSTGFPVPSDPSFRGLTVYAQACVADPGGAFGGLAVSAGLRLTLGE